MSHCGGGHGLFVTSVLLLLTVLTEMCSVHVEVSLFYCLIWRALDEGNGGGQ